MRLLDRNELKNCVTQWQRMVFRSRDARRAAAAVPADAHDRCRDRQKVPSPPLPAAAAAPVSMIDARVGHVPRQDVRAGDGHVPSIDPEKATSSSRAANAVPANPRDRCRDRQEVPSPPLPAAAAATAVAAVRDNDRRSRRTYARSRRGQPVSASASASARRSALAASMISRRARWTPSLTSLSSRGSDCADGSGSAAAARRIRCCIHGRRRDRHLL